MTDKIQGYNMVATPSSIEDKLDSRQKPYLKIRASIARTGKDPIVRTIKAEGKARDALLPVLKVGEATTIRGYYDKMPANDDGTRAEFVVAFGLPKAKAA